MELEVGMYVRFKDKRGNTYIRKIIDIPKDNRYASIYIDKEANYTNNLSFKNVLKASHNIIDLIEVGDIISYEYPTGLGMISYENVTILPELLNTLQNGENNHEYKIKSIVTKEQFEAMEYKVESEVK